MKKLIIYIIIIALIPGFALPASAAVKVKKLKLSVKSVSLKIGQKKKLKIIVKPNYYRKKVKWKSANIKIATVSSTGVVKGKNAGKTRVTASIRKKKVFCAVTVTPPPPPKSDKDTLVPYSYEWTRMKKTDPKFVLPGDIPTQKQDVYEKAIQDTLVELNRLRKKEDNTLPTVSLSHNVHQKTVLTRAQDCLFFMDETHERPDGSSRATAGLTGATAEVCTYEEDYEKINNIPQIGLQSFWESPPHKKILMSKDFDKVAIGMCYLKNKKDSCYFLTMVIQPAGFTSKYELTGNRLTLFNRINEYRKNSGLEKLQFNFKRDYNFAGVSSIYMNEKRAKNYCVIKGDITEYSADSKIYIKDFFFLHAGMSDSYLEFKLPIDEFNYQYFTRFSPNYGIYTDETGTEKTSSAYTWYGTAADNNFNAICDLLFSNKDFLGVISSRESTHIYLNGFYDHFVLAKF